MPNTNVECVCMNPPGQSTAVFVIWKYMPTSLATNCPFRIFIYTILLHHVSQLKHSPKSLFSSLSPLQGRKKIFYLTTYLTHFLIYGYMVKDHSDSERGNPLPPHGLLFPINSKGSFICTIPQTGLHIPRHLLHQSWSTGWNEK